MLTETLNTYCKLFNDRHDSKRLELFFQSSPYYPSMLSILHALKYAGINAEAGKCDLNYLQKMKSPFLLHTQKGGQEKLMLAKWNDQNDKLSIFHPKEKRWNEIHLELLTKLWDGIVIFTNQELSKKSLKRILYRKQGETGLIVSLILCLIIIFITRQWIAIPVIIGLAASYILYFKDRMNKVNFIERICHISSATNCDIVSNSSYDSFAGIKLSTLALSFYLSQLVTAMMGLTLKQYSLNQMYLTAFLGAVPATAYSVYSQIKLHKICPFCVVTFTMLITEGIIYLTNPVKSFNIQILFLWGIYFVAILIILHLFTKNREMRFNLQTKETQLLTLKRKKDILAIESSGLQHAEPVMWFGNKDAKISVAAYISPHCPHCRRMVRNLIEIHKKGMDMRWELIFCVTSPRDEESIISWIELYLEDKEKCLDSLEKWSVKKIEKPESYGDPNNKESIANICDAFKKRIIEAKITGFPRLAFDSRLLSSVYSAGDLDFLIADRTTL